MLRGAALRYLQYSSVWTHCHTWASDTAGRTGSGGDASDFLAQITSYDYSAPISEAGGVGQPGIGGDNKFEACGCSLTNIVKTDPRLSNKTPADLTALLTCTSLVCGARFCKGLCKCPLFATALLSAVRANTS